MHQTKWLTLAKALRIGRTTKTQHCGTDRSALVSHNDRGYSLHCFRCHVREFSPHGERSLREIMEQRRQADILGQSEGIPDHATTCEHWPHHVAAWVLRCNLPLEAACYEFGFRFDVRSGRLLIPLIGQAGFLGRATRGEKPKWRIYGTGSSYALLSGQQGYLVVVEDVMSAIAVNRAGWPALAILGTSITEAHAQIMAVPNLVCWFDSDSAGNEAWIKLRKRMALWPTKLTRIMTKRDPKFIHRAEIKVLLEAAHA